MVWRSSSEAAGDDRIGRCVTEPRHVPICVRSGFLKKRAPKGAVIDRLMGGSQPGAGPPMSFSEVVCTERQESSALQEQLIWGGAGRARIPRARLIGGAVWLIRW